MKQYFVKIIVWIPVIVIGILIFGFSNQNATESSGLSVKIARQIIAVGEQWNLISMDGENSLVLIEKLQYPIRKAAHMTEYMLFAISLTAALYVWNMRGKRLLWMAFALTAAYACTDEFHQLFIPGRAGLVSDVVIDSIGGFIGVVISETYFRIKWKLYKIYRE